MLRRWPQRVRTTLPCLPVTTPACEPTIADLGEAGLLELVFARVALDAPANGSLLVGPGDDTAYLVGESAVLATTDTMVRDRDWREEWSTATDVGAKAVTQNLADIAAMGGVGTSLLVTLIAPGTLPTRWALDFVDGLVSAAHAAGVQIAGGDLSSSTGDVSVSVTALGRLPHDVGSPVLRGGARLGHMLAVSGALGRSAAGLEILRRSERGWFPPPRYAEAAATWVGYHCRPDPDLSQGPIAARAGATSLIDISDGLTRDADRLASASGVDIEFDETAIHDLAAAFVPALGREVALECVFGGGEEHVLLGTFEEGAVPAGWSTLGVVSPRSEQAAHVWWAGEPAPGPGWDHFGR